jgi:hypothetical protein
METDTSWDIPDCVMSEPFDLYVARADEVFRPGETVTLDSIDGFYDQYFDAVTRADRIRFVVLVGGPSELPRSPVEAQRMPFVTARVIRGGAVGGDVLVESVSTLGDWVRSLELRSEPIARLEARGQRHLLASTIAAARRDGVGFWKSPARSWKHLDETSAVLAIHHTDRLRVVMLTTNASSSWVAEVEES